jgi:DNA polymerase III alpha subunit (gram-positive type)
MNYDKVLYFDCETLCLDPKMGSVRELAYVKEIKGKQIGEIQAYKVQPILHMEDNLYGKYDINDFCASYNKKVGHAADPDCLLTFSFPGGDPLFFHSRAALTFNLPPPQVINPADWLIGNDIVLPYKAILTLIDYLSEDDGIKGRWVLAGHNVTYDYNVLTWWAKRLLGEAESALLLDKFNKYAFLDTLALSRWFQYSGRLKTDRANLGDVAKELGVDTTDMHTARADVFASKEIARILLERSQVDGNV